MKNEPRAEPSGAASGSAFRALWHGQVIAESDSTLEVDGYRYFPRETVRMDLLHETPKSESDLECPHGVQFYDVGEGSSRSARAAWSYEAPGKMMQPVDHWIGFWEDVEVGPAPGDRPSGSRG
jgi:uncharacterized protein (DUF427 family)